MTGNIAMLVNGRSRYDVRKEKKIILNYNVSNVSNLMQYNKDQQLYSILATGFLLSNFPDYYNESFKVRQNRKKCKAKNLGAYYGWPYICIILFTKYS